uniref:Uncharacterized protein n=1 Tax=Arundo donax TaxID=35708 RepID=A0A0A9F0P6_ARUDO
MNAQLGLNNSRKRGLFDRRMPYSPRKRNQKNRGIMSNILRATTNLMME